MKCQFPYCIFKFVKYFLYHFEYYDIDTFRLINIEVIDCYMITFWGLNKQFAV